MLIQGGCMVCLQDQLVLTNEGLSLCASMVDGKSEKLADCIKDIPFVLSKIDSIASDNVFNRFFIAL